MNTSERLIIPFKGLKEGWHDFNFRLTEKYFQAIEYAEFKQGSLDVKIQMERKATHLVFEVEVEGVVNVMCDRCLEFFDMHTEFSGSLFVKFSHENDTDIFNEELLILLPEENEVDLTHYVYESICLSLPYQKIHPLDGKGKSTCNKAMLKKIKQYGIHLGEEIDPRWEKLKNIN